jgi:hypothetical protein
MALPPCPARPLLRQLSLATRLAGSIGGLYPGRSLLRRPLPGPHAPFTPVVHRSPAASSASPYPTPGPVGLDLTGTQNQVQLTSGPCFYHFLSLGCHLGGCRIGLVEIVNGSERHVTDRQMN